MSKKHFFKKLEKQLRQQRKNHNIHSGVVTATDLPNEKDNRSETVFLPGREQKGNSKPAETAMSARKVEAKVQRFEIRSIQGKPDFLTGQSIQGKTIVEVLRVAMHSGYQKFIVYDRKEGKYLKCCQGRVFSIFRVLFSRYFLMALSDFPALFSGEKVLFIKGYWLPQSPEDYHIVISRDNRCKILFQKEDFVPGGQIC